MRFKHYELIVVCCGVEDAEDGVFRSGGFTGVGYECTGIGG